MSRKRKDEEDKFEQELTTPEEVEQKVAEPEDQVEIIIEPDDSAPENDDSSEKIDEKSNDVSPTEDSGNGKVADEFLEVEQEVVEGDDDLRLTSNAGGDAEYAQLAEAYDRLRAEFANYKRRIEREKEEFVDAVRGGIIREFLPIVDDFQLMLEKSAEGDNDVALLDGARMIFDKMVTLMDRQGLSKIEALGQPFDPQIHEALMTQPTDLEEQNEKVVQVFQDGFMLNTTLIRPSKVVVGKYDD